MADEITPIDLTGLDKYYQDEFTKIHESNGVYKGKWNWWAFFFTWIWCFLKGCWLIGLLSMLTISILIYKIPLAYGIYLGFGASTGIIWMLLLGWRGTMIYYYVKIHKRQFPPLLFM